MMRAIKVLHELSNDPAFVESLNELAAALLQHKQYTANRRALSTAAYRRAVRRLDASIDRSPALRRLRARVQDEDSDRVDAECEAHFLIGFELGRRVRLIESAIDCHVRGAFRMFADELQTDIDKHTKGRAQ